MTDSTAGAMPVSGSALRIRVAADAEGAARWTLAGILAAVVQRHPALRTFEARSRASLLRTRDQLQPPNPELQADVGGSGPFDDLLAGIELALPLRPRGQVEAVRGSGAAERTVLAAECALATSGLLADAAGAYADWLAAGDREALAGEELEVARGFETHARRRQALAMGGDLPVLQAEILVEDAMARRAEAEGQGRSARARLAALAGGPSEDARPDSGAAREEWTKLLSAPEEVSALSAAGATGGAPGDGDTISVAPALLASRARFQAAQREVELVRSSRRVSPRLGVRAERDTGGELKLFALAGFPLPIFSRAGPAVAAAEADAEAARWQTAADSLALAGELAAALSDYRTARDALSSLEQETLPRAERLETAARENAQSGAAGFVLWLEARRSYLELRAREVDLKRQAARAALELRRATGEFRPLLEGTG